jgi:hypothetical protein
LKDSLKKLNLALYEKIYKKVQKIRKIDVNIHIHWVPGHMGIYGNEKADQAAKYGAEWAEFCPELGLSTSFLKRKYKEKTLKEWSNQWQNGTQGKHYKQFKTYPKWKATPIRISKHIWSRIMQLKLGHGYFRSYLVRMPEYNSDICQECQTNQKQTPFHLLFQCSSQSETRKETIQKLDKKDQNLYNLFMDKTGQKQLITFLKESKVATRKWVLRQT